MYRTIVTDFWDDIVVEDLSTNSKLLLLYVLTSPVGNIAGCYPLSIKRITRDTGLSADAAQKSLEELCGTGRIAYSTATNEVLVVNWPKYNWTKSEKTMKAVDRAIAGVRDETFRSHLEQVRQNACSMGYISPIDTPYIPTVSVSVPVTGTEGEKATSNDVHTRNKGSEKHRHGEFSNVLLTDYELEQLKARFPDWKKRIDDLSYYIGSKGDKYKSHYRTILSWDRSKSSANPRKEVRLDARYAKYD